MSDDDTYWFHLCPSGLIDVQTSGLRELDRHSQEFQAALALLRQSLPPVSGHAHGEAALRPPKPRNPLKDPGGPREPQNETETT